MAELLAYNISFRSSPGCSPGRSWQFFKIFTLILLPHQLHLRLPLRLRSPFTATLKIFREAIFIPRVHRTATPRTCIIYSLSTPSQQITPVSFSLMFLIGDLLNTIPIGQNSFAQTSTLFSTTFSQPKLELHSLSTFVSSHNHHIFRINKSKSQSSSFTSTVYYPICITYPAFFPLVLFISAFL